MKSTTVPFWLTKTSIFWGHEGNGSEGGEGQGEGSEEGTEGGDGDGSEDGDEGNKNSYTEDEVKGLKSALKKERENSKLTAKERKELKELREAREAKDREEKGDLAVVSDKLTKAEDKLNKLAPAFRNKALQDALLAEARKQKFIDETDVLTDDVRAAVEVEQDEEDPSTVVVDASTVEKAVKKLAKSKPHLVTKSSGNNGQANSKFGGRREGETDESAKDAEIRSLYRF